MLTLLRGSWAELRQEVNFSWWGHRGPFDFCHIRYVGRVSRYVFSFVCLNG